MKQAIKRELQHIYNLMQQHQKHVFDTQGKIDDDISSIPGIIKDMPQYIVQDVELVTDVKTFQDYIVRLYHTGKVDLIVDGIVIHILDNLKPERYLSKSTFANKQEGYSDGDLIGVLATRVVWESTDL